jgi:hypothetical protein
MASPDSYDIIKARLDRIEAAIPQIEEQLRELLSLVVTGTSAPRHLWLVQHQPRPSSGSSSRE